VGTPNYMAPEQARGDIAAIGPHSDQAALGAILYEMLTGRPPYVGTSLMHTLELVQKLEPVPPSEFNSEVPRDLETICLKSLQKEPAKRYASCGELVEDLRSFQEGKPIKARPVGQIERTIRWAKRNPTVAALGAAAALLLLAVALGGISFAFYYKDSAEKQRKLREVADGRLESVREKEEVLVNTIPEKIQAGLYTEEVLQAVLALINENHNQFEETGDRHIQARAKAGKHQRLGIGYLRTKELGKAIGEFQTALKIQKEILADNPPDIDKSEGNVAAAYSAIGDAYKLQRKYSDALKSYKEALEIRRRIVQQPRSTELKMPERLTALGAAWTALADLYANAGKFPDAISSAQEALVAYQKVDRKDMKDRDRQSLAMAWYTSGRAKFRADDRDGGRADLEEAFKELKELIASAKPNQSIRQTYAYLLSTAGDLEFLYGKDEDRAELALRRYADAAKIFTELASPPEILRCRRSLSQAQYVLAVAALKAGDPAMADAAIKQCAEIRKELLAGKTDDLDMKYEAMLALARAGLTDDARGIAADLEKASNDEHPKKPKALLLKWAAQGYGLCAEGVGFGRKAPLPPELQKRRLEFLDRAYECLGQAIVNGYRNSSEFETDPDFDPFRNDRRYQSTLASLKTKK
jgi:tetratricopeptide (TPR) repeat protein